LIIISLRVSGKECNFAEMFLQNISWKRKRYLLKTKRHQAENEKDIKLKAESKYTINI